MSSCVCVCVNRFLFVFCLLAKRHSSDKPRFTCFLKRELDEKNRVSTLRISGPNHGPTLLQGHLLSLWGSITPSKKKVVGRQTFPLGKITFSRANCELREGKRKELNRSNFQL